MRQFARGRKAQAERYAISGMPPVAVWQCFVPIDSAIVTSAGTNMQTRPAAGVSMLFHPTPQRLGHYFGAGTLGLLAGALIGGTLADAYDGARRLFPRDCWAWCGCQR